MIRPALSYVSKNGWYFLLFTGWHCSWYRLGAHYYTQQVLLLLLLFLSFSPRSMIPAQQWMDAVLTRTRKCRNSKTEERDWCLMLVIIVDFVLLLLCSKSRAHWFYGHKSFISFSRSPSNTRQIVGTQNHRKYKEEGWTTEEQIPAYFRSVSEASWYCTMYGYEQQILRIIDLCCPTSFWKNVWNKTVKERLSQKLCT